MTQRILNVVAIGLVVLAAFGVGGAMLNSHFNPSRLPPDPPEFNSQAGTTRSPSSRATVSSGRAAAPSNGASMDRGTSRMQAAGTEGALKSSAQVQPSAATTSESAELSSEARIYTWAEVESMLEATRKARSNRPEALEELEGRYNELALPSFTQSKDMTEHCTKLAKWREEFPQSPTPLVVMAKVQIHHAWEARGSGFAYTVTEEGWELFRSRIAEAHRLLDDALKLGPQDGQAYARFLDVARAEGLPRDATQAILDEGMKVDPTYMWMYTSMAEYLLPRWHGEPGDVERFAAEIVERLPGDDGLDAYGHIAYIINQYDCLTDNTIFYGGFDRQLLVKAAEVLVKRYPNARNLPCFAALCTIAAQDHAAACRIRPNVKHQDAPRVPTWKYLAREFDQWCAVKNPPGGEQDWIWGTCFHYGGIGFAANSRYIWCGQGSAGGRAATLLDLDRGHVRTVLASPNSYLKDLAFAQSHSWVVGSFFSPDLQCVAFWDASNSGDIPTVIKTNSRCEAIAIHPELPRVVWAEANEVHVVDIPTGEQLKKMTPGSVVMQLTFSPDGKRLLMGSSACSVWDTTSWERICDLPSARLKPLPRLWCNDAFDIDDEGHILAVATARTDVNGKDGPHKQQIVRFAPDGKTSEMLIADLGAHGRVKPHLARSSPNRRWLAIPEQSVNGNGPERIDLWDLKLGERAKTFDGHWNHVGDLTFSGDNRLLASISQMGGVIKVWKVPEVDAP
jgi:WD domain, G-beta repeat